MSRFREMLSNALKPIGYGAFSRRRLRYDADGIVVTGQSGQFLDEPRFQRAYAAGVASGAKHVNLHVEWRTHICLMAATHALHLNGDFVECGVDTGFQSLAVCDYIDFNATGKSLWLFDTFKGIPDDLMRESREGLRHAYPDTYEQTKASFAKYPKATLVRGRVPETLSTVPIERVAYLAIDMNVPEPERAALGYFWPKLVPGAVVVFDDYGFMGHVDQKAALDEFAASQGVAIWSLPTGQGLLLKP